MLARRALRLLAMDALATIAGVSELVSPGDWDTAPKQLPQIKLRTPDEQKTSIQRGMPSFTTTVVLEIEATVQAHDEGAAQDAIEALVDQIETAVLCWKPKIDLLQQVVSVRTRIAITAEGEQHMARAHMLFALETLETFDPTVVHVPPALQGLDIHVDTIQPADKTATFPDPAFPDSVQPAPRTSGPDGRDEGGLTINLPQ